MINNFGLCILDKREGITSFSAIKELSYKFNIKKVGHAGTLDSFASGILMVFSGFATKLCEVFVGADKTYLAEFEFGRETDTLDINGKTILEAAIPLKSDIERELLHFSGEIYQVPPQYSRVSVLGKRSYLEARSGRKVDIPARKINIYSSSLQNQLDDRTFLFKFEVSSGTYIRSIARDLGRACGSACFVKSLKRIELGSVQLQDAKGIENINESDFESRESILKFIPPNKVLEAPEEIYLRIKDKKEITMALAKEYNLEQGEFILKWRGEVFAVIKNQNSFRYSSFL